MFLIELLYALIIGSAIAWIWSSAFNTHGPWDSFMWFFAVIFLFSWGGGIWVTPFGPTGWGVAWLPFLVMGVFMALLLSAATPRSSRRRGASNDLVPVARNKKVRVAELEQAKEAYDFLLIALVVFLVASIFMHHHF